ncbi:LysR family transcriptional regulator [Myxococcus stipitatus DSM 14675]|uniref:LysR family transcriptional regulator n=1 Tax=Myxococcus stipitatus (strain DSM 14675 / JCM 12634 / Mx s8) TaxID=1278073 RepID=L7U3I1_MYXSD|nr:transcriptional regulator GcvA [Myxococcus stipitatus]AGC43336.1 LysR family transcriptional regulator [Myxococcus stipitatus DSM 14675]
MRDLPPLSALRAFEAAARHLSFKKAADELSVTPTAISHQVRQLEEWLGLRLFERHVRRVVLTKEGKELFPSMREGFDTLVRGIDALRAPPAQEVLTLSSTVAFTSKWLVPRVPAFRAACPGMDLRLHASDEAVDLRAGGVDLAVRYGRGAHEGLRAELLFQDRFAPVCSPRLGVGGVEDLGRHPLIHFEWRRVDDATPTWSRWFASAGRRYRAPGGELRFSDESHAIQAAIAGQGIAMVSLVLVAEELASGALVQPFGPELDGFAYHLVHLETPRHAERLAPIRQWLLSEAKKLEARAPVRKRKGNAPRRR